MSDANDNLVDFQTRLLEASVRAVSAFRTNTRVLTTGSSPSPRGDYNTWNGTIPTTMVTPIGNTSNLSSTTQESILSETDEELTANYRFVDLPASIVQLLTPKVEIYKVYKSENDALAPDKVYPLHQGRYTKNQIRRALSEGSATGADDNMQGVVLQAVEFTRLGGNPAEVHKVQHQIVCKEHNRVLYEN